MNNLNNKKVVILGGGTGSSRVLMSLKDLPLDITAIITVSDNGGSTGRIREEFTIPGVGDIRKVLSNLSTFKDGIRRIERIVSSSPTIFSTSQILSTTVCSTDDADGIQRTLNLPR